MPYSRSESLLCLYRFGSALPWCVLCVSDVLTAPTSELRSRFARRRRLHRSVPVAVRDGRCWSVLSALVIVCTLLVPVDGQAEEAKCEDLEKFTVGDDSKKFFQVGA